MDDLTHGRQYSPRSLAGQRHRCRHIVVDHDLVGRSTTDGESAAANLLGEKA